MIRFRLAGLIVLAGVLAISCGDDDDPVASDSPCDDANTTCLALTVRPDDMIYDMGYHDPPIDQSWHAVNWNIDGVVLSNYRPGQVVMASVTFDPPITVRYEHMETHFSFMASGVSCLDRFTNYTGEASSNGWPIDTHSVYSYGDCVSGASAVSVSIHYEPLVVGNKLRRVDFEFTVPDTYAGGTSEGAPVLPGNLNVGRVGVVAWTDGDTTADGPAIWPGEYSPATAPGGR